jgi:predicted MPP superfamily phosphohydrolase
MRTEAVARVPGVRPRRLGWKLVMLVLAAAFFMLVLLLVLSNTWIQSTTWQLPSRRIPMAFDGYCIVQLSDLHNGRFGSGQRRLVRVIRRQCPDLIALTGDLVGEDWRRSGNSLELIRRLAAVAPTYFVIGNHDVHTRDLPGLLAFLESQGVQVLRNASSLIRRGGEAIALGGVDDPEAFADGTRRWAEQRAAWRLALARLRENTDAGMYTILLSHRPELISDYAALGFDLVLSGHAHGGLIRLPLVGALYAPDQGRLPRYTSGLHVLGATSMIVSRGLGRGKTPLRLFNRPEVVIVRLKAGSPAPSPNQPAG